MSDFLEDLPHRQYERHERDHTYTLNDNETLNAYADSLVRLDDKDELKKRIMKILFDNLNLQNLNEALAKYAINASNSQTDSPKRKKPRIHDSSTPTQIETIEQKSITNIFYRFPHIAEKVFGMLNDKDLVKCRGISNDWKKIIDNQKLPWIRMIKKHEFSMICNTYDYDEDDYEDEGHHYIEEKTLLEIWRTFFNSSDVETIHHIACMFRYFYYRPPKHLRKSPPLFKNQEIERLKIKGWK